MGVHERFLHRRGPRHPPGPVTDRPDGGEPPLRGPASLSKPQLDVGYFTNHADAVLAFWRETVGLAGEPPVPFNDGLVQHRHALGGSVVKVNTGTGGVGEGVPTGYRELLVARPDLTAPERLHDPDGNPVTLVPAEHLGVRGIAVRLLVRDLARHRRFYTQVMGFAEEAPGHFRTGDSLLIVDEDPDVAPAGHWVNAGFRYVTLHVRRVDATFDAMTGDGATVGERPYAIERIAKISFVRDPDGNWIEVAQRASLAGPWWDTDDTGPAGDG